MRTQIDQLMRDALARFAAERDVADGIDLDPRVERTRDSKHGDFTSHVALRLAGPLRQPAREIAAALVAGLPESELIAAARVAGPGFINLTVSADAYQGELLRLLDAAEAYGRSGQGAGRRVLVEYVSANPTGPLHVGHGRHAAYGASVANLLRATGHDVHEEYYVNDAGRQMDILAASVWLRCLQHLGEDIEFPEAAYQGDYVRGIARNVARDMAREPQGVEPRYGEPRDGEGHGSARIDPGPLRGVLADPPADADALLDTIVAAVREGLGEARFADLIETARDRVLDDIREDLAAFGVRPHTWYSERGLVESDALAQALQRLNDRGQLYERDGAVWFRATAYGDRKDRVVVRENGASTYFASDIAYHADKRARGFGLLLDVLGADHHGYVARIRAGLEAMGEPGESLEVRLVQFATLYRGREKVRMSTRAGEYVTLRQLREEVGNDAARFFYVSRSNDQHLDFDLDLAKTQGNDNPVYYVQYAHARVASLLNKMVEEGFSPAPASRNDLRRLTEPAEQALLVSLSRYPEVLHLAAANRAPQHLVQYLRALAGSFHSCYNAHRVLVDDAPLRNARVALARGVQQVLRNGMTLLGVTAPERM